MSIISGGSRPNSDFDYWEFVHCAICSLPFIADPPAPPGPPSVPFWLTECGHTLCNNHLHADQSCAACGATAIQLIPLQRDMIAPMCEWFRSIPHGLDALASAAKFQQETMASLIRSYKRKCSQQRATILKTKDVIAENKALRSQMEQLQQEMEHLRVGAGASPKQHLDQRRSYGMNQSDPNQTLSYEPSDARNANGKRPLVDPRHHQRTSSPRSITTPLAPPRITLPPDHQQPVFPSGMSAAHPSEDPRDRPGSSRFEHYAYQPPTTPFRAQPLRHQQQPQDHRRQHEPPVEGHQQQQQQQRQGQAHRSQNQQQLQQPEHQRMPPPPTPSRAQGGNVNSRGPFRPALPQSARRTQTHPQLQPPSQLPSTAGPRHPRPVQPFPMSVPATPHGTNSSSRLLSTPHMNSRFAVPPTPSNRFFAPPAGGVVIGTSRVRGNTDAGGGVRAPFVPGMR